MDDYELKEECGEDLLRVVYALSEYTTQARHKAFKKCIKDIQFARTIEENDVRHSSRRIKVLEEYL